ncbi:MAG: hypothetical protein WHU94_15960 [Thermogemmata sp.]|uniref:Uncharacterized protein n=1 Tax=Thermogemmata fonticola TaxID=2755323 RepID=A0A7V8VBG0_9BACT|nr:hypothetical protein [Thermogemmata fonticola]MBA2224966.1 hypothetical protein [Thermogemmata fonticola]MCX8139116.1 hypothetical protein [Gemmataceae bacterium]
MLEIDIAADTELGQQAKVAVEQYLRQHGEESYRSSDDWPIARSQISGLRQIAMNEPRQVAAFAEHQRKKAEAKLETTTKEERRSELEAEIAFWDLIKGLCDGKQPRVPWSLTQARDQALPAELQEEKQPPGAKLTKEQQEARKQKREERERWLRQWESEHYPVFFQRFCAHYLYEMARRTQSEKSDKGD